MDEAATGSKKISTRVGVQVPGTPLVLQVVHVLASSLASYRKTLYSSRPCLLYIYESHGHDP